MGNLAQRSAHWATKQSFGQGGETERPTIAAEKPGVEQAKRGIVEHRQRQR